MRGYHGLLPASVSLSLSHEREGRFPGSFIVVQPKFPIHYVDTLAPAAAFAPRHASRLCNYAFRRSRCSAAPVHLLPFVVTSTRLSPFSALGSSERETDDRVGSESSPGSQVGGPPTNVPSVRLPNRHYYRNKGATAGERGAGRTRRGQRHMSRKRRKLD